MISPGFTTLLQLLAFYLKVCILHLPIANLHLITHQAEKKCCDSSLVRIDLKISGKMGGKERVDYT